MVEGWPGSLPTTWTGSDGDDPTRMALSSECSPDARTNRRIHRGGPTRSTTARRNRTHRERFPMERFGATTTLTKTPKDTSYTSPTKQPTQIIQFPGMVALWERFWSEVPKAEFDPTD